MIDFRGDVTNLLLVDNKASIVEAFGWDSMKFGRICFGYIQL